MNKLKSKLFSKRTFKDKEQRKRYAIAIALLNGGDGGATMAEQIERLRQEAMAEHRRLCAAFGVIPSVYKPIIPHTPQAALMQSELDPELGSSTSDNLGQLVNRELALSILTQAARVGLL